jgi:hypothetical protein
MSLRDNPVGLTHAALYEEVEAKDSNTSMKNKFKKMIGSGILTFGLALSALAQTSETTALSADQSTVYIGSTVAFTR